MMTITDFVFWGFMSVGVWTVINWIGDRITGTVRHLAAERRSIIEEQDQRARAAVRARDLNRSQIR